MEEAMKKARELLEMVAPYDLSEFEYADDLVSIKFSKGLVAAPATAPAAPAATVPAASPSPAAPAAATAPPPAATPSSYVEIPSPMVGTFYSAPAPDKPPYVSEGDMVEKNQVVCIIEAMKLMNEIKSPVRGKVVKIFAKNATGVNKDDVLFHVDPA